MVVHYFLKWIDTARVAERAAAARALAVAYVNGDLAFEDHCAAEAALTLLLDDPSQKVRMALAEALSTSRKAPPQIIAALASDQPEIAAVVLGRSPLFSDADLIDRAAAGSGAVQRMIAERPGIGIAVAAAIAEVGEVEACLALLSSPHASIASLSFRRIAERHGDVAAVREALIADPRLPPDCRHMLLVKVGEALRRSPLIKALMGAARADRVTREACVRASLSMIDGTRIDEHAALVEHLRLSGELTSGFIVRIVAHGKIDFFGSILVALTGYDEARIVALLAQGRDVALSALFRTAGLPGTVGTVLLCALKVWREVANGRRLAGVQEVTWLMLKELGETTADADLAGLLKAIHLDSLRDNARQHALAIAAA
jgi:uncharacterized protein (DUF2336 family)